MTALRFLAGRTALDEIRRHGFDPAQIKVVAGASGGPKWLALSRLDQVLFPTLFDGRSKPVYLIGSSVGSWRHAVIARTDTARSVARFEEIYLNYRWQEAETADEVSDASRLLLREVMGATGFQEILSHPVYRTSIMTVRCKGLAASEARLPLALGMLAAAGLNLVSRRTLGLSFQRGLFSDPRDAPPFLGMDEFPIHRLKLDAGNIEDVLMASGSIPVFMAGIRDIEGAPGGMYRDGGTIDYHWDVELSGGEGLVLFPHFFHRLAPGWFDKKMDWRRPRAASTDRMLVLAPSPEFAAALPGGKIPDRNDFRTYDGDTRIALWRGVLAETQRLADEFQEAYEKERIPALLEPLRG
jgi:hypothetical protein